MQNKIAIILLGPQGSGKGTLAKHLVASLSCINLNVTHIDMGQILREKKTTDPSFANLSRIYADRGELLPDHVIMDVFGERLASIYAQNNIFLLDGCVRTKEQAEAVKTKLGELEIQSIVIVLDLPLPVCIERIANRVKKDIAVGKPTRQDDSDLEAVDRRLKTYFSLLFEILFVFGDHDTVSAKPLEYDVLASVLRIINSYLY